MKITKNKLIKLYTKTKNFVFSAYDEELLHYAASLSFHTLLSIIPILLISFSIFTQLPSFDEYYIKLKEFIFANLLPSHQEAISGYIEQFLENKISLGVFGIVAITITSLMFFSDYEYVVSKIMSTEKKSFWKSFSKYWTLITLAPLGLLFSFYLSSVIQDYLNKTYLGNWINIINLFPYIIIWGIFAITYHLSVNENSSFKNILVGSFCASLIWNISKFAFVKYVFYSKTYLSLYGSFSILLFFFLWIYIAWIIFLYGLKISYALDKIEHNHSTKNQNIAKEPISDS